MEGEGKLKPKEKGPTRMKDESKVVSLQAIASPDLQENVCFPVLYRAQGLTGGGEAADGREGGRVVHGEGF